MRQLLRVAFATTAAMVLAASPVAGYHYPDWASSSETINLSSMSYATRIPNDTYRMRTTMSWTTAKAADMRHWASTYGKRFTDDVHVSQCTLSATTRRETNLENPYFDRDSHTCPDYLFRAEEAEIVAEDAGAITFPQAGITYYTNVYFERWACNSSQSVCAWDPDSGSASYDESLSELNIFCDDKWCTVANQVAHLGTKSYAYQSWPPPGSLSAPDATADAAQVQNARPMGAVSPRSAAGDLTLEAFSLEISPEGDSTIRPDLTMGLDVYAARSRSLALQLVSRGPSRGIITFSRPLDSLELEGLAALGVRFLDLEAVSTPAVDGTRWTAADRDATRLQWAMRDIELEFGVEFLGVVAAEVVVPSPSVLANLQAADEVWLVDLSIEQAGRTHSELIDIGQNDLWWWLAGW